MAVRGGGARLSEAIEEAYRMAGAGGRVHLHSDQGVANIVWASGKLDESDKKLSMVLATAATWHMGSFKPQGLAGTWHLRRFAPRVVPKKANRKFPS